MCTVISAVRTTLKLLWKGVWCYTKTLLIWSTWGPKICLQIPWLWIIPPLPSHSTHCHVMWLAEVCLYVVSSNFLLLCWVVVVSAATWKVLGLILDGVIGVFHQLNPSGHAMVLESTSVPGATWVCVCVCVRACARARARVCVCVSLSVIRSNNNLW